MRVSLTWRRARRACVRGYRARPCGSHAADKYKASEERFRRLFQDPADTMLLLLHTAELASRHGFTGTTITGQVGPFKMPAKTFPLKR